MDTVYFLMWVIWWAGAIHFFVLDSMKILRENCIFSQAEYKSSVIHRLSVSLTDIGHVLNFVLHCSTVYKCVRVKDKHEYNAAVCSYTLTHWSQVTVRWHLGETAGWNWTGRYYWTKMRLCNKYVRNITKQLYINTLVSVKSVKAQRFVAFGFI